ncbi:MAG: TPM domain-containing protein [Lachnospiraceae bacterium]|nr:TPM domain-containing protein [Lachnospiraceae bacterium]MCM1238885.1 TPM domain-containing protein [Lachnospiraceae bacterium]
MSNEIKKEARKQYFRYFRIWFIGIGILLVITVILGVDYAIASDIPRTNHSAPAERVYDYADALTDEEEDGLRERIAEVEGRLHIDIVLVTIDQPMKGAEAIEQSGCRSTDWERNMTEYADDFWDENRYGYNKEFEGDGCLFVHNWYEGQTGGHLSTSGRVETRFSNADIDDVFDAVAKYNRAAPYKAYMAYVNEVASIMSSGSSGTEPFPFILVIMVPLVVALVYAMKNLHQKAAQDTTTANTYVEGGRPVMREQADDFIRKNVVTRRIESSSGSSRSGSSHSSGGGGHHTSRSGASHGGGSRRF